MLQNIPEQWSHTVKSSVVLQHGQAAFVEMFTVFIKLLKSTFLGTLSKFSNVNVLRHWGQSTNKTPRVTGLTLATAFILNFSGRIFKLKFYYKINKIRKKITFNAFQTKWMLTTKCSRINKKVETYRTSEVIQYWFNINHYIYMSKKEISLILFFFSILWNSNKKNYYLLLF